MPPPIRLSPRRRTHSQCDATQSSSRTKSAFVGRRVRDKRRRTRVNFAGARDGRDMIVASTVASTRCLGQAGRQAGGTIEN